LNLLLLLLFAAAIRQGRALPSADAAAEQRAAASAGQARTRAWLRVSNTPFLGLYYLRSGLSNGFQICASCQCRAGAHWCPDAGEQYATPLGLTFVSRTQQVGSC
jgi:hypothetical protein